ncbi:hypothetical protein DRO42_07095, partial [Candidatus Bathyarchaeota archaeon]
RERIFVEERMREVGVPIAAHIPYDPAVAEADMLGEAPLDHDEDSPAVEAVLNLKEFLKSRYGF